MRKRRETGKDPARREQRPSSAVACYGGWKGGRRGYIIHTHVRLFVGIPGKPSARLTSRLKLITGQRSLRFSILKQAPTAP